MVGRTFDLDSSGAAAWAKSGLKELERTEQREQLLDKAQRGSKTAGQELNSMFRTEDQTSLKKLAQSNDPLGRMARTEMSRREQEARALAALQAQRANASNKMIDMGDQGESVKAVQEKLRTLGYNIAADGQFGAQTQAAVRQFQRDYGIKADGVVGNQTFSVLGAADSTRHASDTIKAAAIQSAKQSRPGDISGHTLILSEASMNNVLREVERLARQAGPNAYVRTNIVDNKPVIVGIGYRQQPSANPRIQVMNSGSGSPASNPVQSATPSMNPVQISLQS
ncbi:peptidoglycan-binding protein, partial [Paenibacillus alkaliterrae]